MNADQIRRSQSPEALALRALYADLAAESLGAHLAYHCASRETPDTTALDAWDATRNACRAALDVHSQHIAWGRDVVTMLSESLDVTDSAARLALLARYAGALFRLRAPRVHAEYSECDDAACGCHPPEPAPMVDEPEACARCHGRGILVPDCVDNHAQAMAAASECPDCDGLGEVYPDQRVGLTAMASEPVEALPVEVAR